MEVCVSLEGHLLVLLDILSPGKQRKEQVSDDDLCTVYSTATPGVALSAR